MRKLLLLLAISLAFAPAALAQDYSDWEFYVGYAHERANNGADRLDGGVGAISEPDQDIEIGEPGAPDRDVLTRREGRC